MTYPFKTKPFKHQLEALAAMKGKKKFALLMEMGTGKSKVALDDCGMNFLSGELNGVVIFLPKSLIKTWTDEQIAFHLPDSIKRRIHVYENRGTKKEADQLKSICANLPETLDFFIINYESAATKRGYASVEKFIKSKKGCCALADESTFIKNAFSKRSKRCRKLGLLCDYARIITGTEAPESPLDLYGQFAFLQGVPLGYSSFIAFRAAFAILKKRVIQVKGRVVEFLEIEGYQNIDHLKSLVDKLSFRKLKKDCLDLPPKVYQPRYLDMSEEMDRCYQDMCDTLMVEFSDGKFTTAKIAIAKLTYLREIAANWIKITGTKEVRQICKTDQKIEEIIDIIEVNPKRKYLIFANFTFTIDAIIKALNEKFGMDYARRYDGKIKDHEKETNKKAFQDGSLPVLVLDTGTGGFGLTLTAANTVIYYDNDWPLLQRQQSEDRAHRSGLKHSVNYIDLIYKKSINTQIIASLKKKEDMQNRLGGKSVSVQDILNRRDADVS